MTLLHYYKSNTALKADLREPKFGNSAITILSSIKQLWMKKIGTFFFWKYGYRINTNTILETKKFTITYIKIIFK